MDARRAQQQPAQDLEKKSITPLQQAVLSFSIKDLIDCVFIQGAKLADAVLYAKSINHPWADHLEPSPLLRKAVCYRLIQDFDTYKDEYVKTRISNFLKAKKEDLPHLIEFAAFCNQPVLAYSLLNDSENLRRDLLIRTPGYWAVVHNNPQLFAAVCEKPEDAFYTLWQLEHDNVELKSDFIKTLKEEVISEYPNKKAELQQKYDEYEINNLTRTQLNAYEYASKKLSEEYVRYGKDIKDRVAVANTSIQANNFVALSVVIDQIKDSDKALSFLEEVAKINFEQLLFLNFTTSFAAFDKLLISKNIAEKIKDTKVLLLYLLSLPGFIQSKQFTEAQQQLFRHISKRDVDVFNCLMLILKIIHPHDQIYTNLLKTPEDSNLKKRITEANLTQPQQRTLDDYFSALSLRVRCNELPSDAVILPKTIWQQVFILLVTSKQKYSGQLSLEHPIVALSILNKEYARLLFAMRYPKQVAAEVLDEKAEEKKEDGLAKIKRQIKPLLLAPNQEQFLTKIAQREEKNQPQALILESLIRSLNRLNEDLEDEGCLRGRSWEKICLNIVPTLLLAGLITANSFCVNTLLTKEEQYIKDIHAWVDANNGTKCFYAFDDGMPWGRSSIDLSNIAPAVLAICNELYDNIHNYDDYVFFSVLTLISFCISILFTSCCFFPAAADLYSEGLSRFDGYRLSEFADGNVAIEEVKEHLHGLNPNPNIAHTKANLNNKINEWRAKVEQERSRIQEMRNYLQVLFPAAPPPKLANIEVLPDNAVVDVELVDDDFEDAALLGNDRGRNHALHL